MTTLEFARTECANYQSNGSCLGVEIADNLELIHRLSKPRCLLADDKRCKYFEECVMPTAIIATDPARSKAFHQAVDSYKIIHQLSGVHRQCPMCGRPLASRKQFCPSCALKRKKTSNREVARERRGIE